MQTSQVFVSHTSDMARCPEGRSFVQAALDAVVRARLIPVDMRHFAARDGRPADYCQARVRECEIYVAVVGFRYGSVVPGAAVSFTELEFQAASAAGLPRLVFLLEETVGVPGGRADADRGPVDGFRQRLSDAGLIVRSFTSAADLELEVFYALVELTGTSRPAEIRQPATLLSPAAVDDPVRRDAAGAHAGGSQAQAVSRAPGMAAEPSGCWDEVAGYLQRLIAWVNTDPWPRDRRFDGPVLTPAAIERRLRVSSLGPLGEEVLEADDLARQCRRLVVLGGPGSGKTWLAKRAARRCAEDALEALAAGAGLDEVELPLYTTCSQLFGASGNIREAAVSSSLDQLGDLGGPRVNADLRAFIAGRRAPVLLVIDSLDEAHGSRERLRQADTLPWRVMLTTRPSSWNQQLAIDDTDNSHRVGELQPLRYPEDVEPFIRAWFAYQPGRAGNLAAQIAQRAGFQQAATVPLILAFYCIVGGHESLPESRRDLYGRVLSRLLTGRWRGDEDQHPDISGCMEVLRACAWPGTEAQHPDSGIGAWADDIRTPNTELGDADQSAVDHVAMSLGPADIDTGHTPRRFIHRAIREHLVAEYAAHLPVSRAAEELLPHLWYDPDWEYSAPAAIAMHPERDQLLRGLICRAAGSEQIPADLSVIDAGWSFRELLARIVPESSEADWTPEIAEVISRARVELALSGRVDGLDGSALWPGSDRNVRNTLLRLLTDPANAWATEKLVGAVVRLATTVDDRRRARQALLGLLPGHGSGFEAARFMSKVVGGVVQLAVTAADKRMARAALLRRLAGQTDGWLANELATGISQLSPSDRQRRLVRDTLLALAPGQGDDGEAVWLVGRATNLAMTDQEKRETRDRILGLLAGRFRGWAADEMTTIATRLFPAADDSQARDVLPCQADYRKADNPTSGIVWRRHATEGDGLACGELLEALAGETDGRTAAGIAAAVTRTSLTAPEKHQARKMLLRLLSSQTNGRTAAELAGAVSRLSPSAEDNHQVRETLLPFLDTQIPTRTVTWLVDGIIQADPAPNQKQLVRDALLRLLAIQNHGHQVTKLANRISRLDPPAKDKHQTREALHRSMASQVDGQLALKLAGCLRGLEPTAADRRQAREVLLGLLGGQADSQLTRELASMVVQLAVTASDRRQAREALLGMLPIETSPAQTGNLVAAVVQFAITSRGKHQARQAFLSTLTQADGWSAIELIAGLIQLSPTPREKNQARNTMLRFLKGETSWPLAARLLDGLAQLDPAIRDVRTWPSRKIPPTAELLAAVRRNSKLTEWVEAIPYLEPLANHYANGRADRTVTG